MDRHEIYSDITVLSLEQALALPYGTYRLAQEGMRIIRIESPLRGDPNRYVGNETFEERGMNSYFLPVNAGKESITLNPQGGGRETYPVRPHSYPQCGYLRLQPNPPELCKIGHRL
jgi:crotonobetainyl-CoA:carnitine CoA-transferase CaiB-like acyl-CoA transferase